MKVLAAFVKRCRPAFALLALLLVAGLASAQQAPNEVEARPLINVEDKDDINKPDGKIWVLNFSFYPPRTITVDIPGRGRDCWYLRYDIVNRTKEPRPFIPTFELVPTDHPGKVYLDQVLPKVQEAISQVEDPLGHLELKNSVSISSRPIPVSRPGGPPKPVSGVAIWDDVPPDSNRFSIFVSGLSNGWSLAEVPPDNKQVIKRKTLQLNFKRVGDRYTQQTGDIKFQPPVEWVYRGTGVMMASPTLPAKKD